MSEDVISRAEAMSETKSDGHLTLFRFTTHWKAILGTPVLTKGDKAAISKLSPRDSLLGALDGLLQRTKPKIRDFRTIHRWFEMGDHLSDEEMVYLYRRYRRVQQATDGFPEYGATNFHATAQLVKLRPFLKARNVSLEDG